MTRRQAALYLAISGVCLTAGAVLTGNRWLAALGILVMLWSRFLKYPRHPNPTPQEPKE